MLDYRTNPEESPLVWCPIKQKLVSSCEASKVMKTVFHIDPRGIFPYGISAQDEERQTETVAY